MKRFAIFKMAVAGNEGVPTVSFTCLANPANIKKPLVIEAESAEGALPTAQGLMKSFGVKTHSIFGDYSTVLSHLPDYFLGELRDAAANMCDTFEVALRVHSFTPLPESE